MVSINDIPSIRSAAAYCRDGNKIGRVGDVYVDDYSQQPAWVTITAGLFGTKTLFAPLAGATLQGDRLVLGYSKDVVANAPAIADSGHISDTEQQALIDYFNAHAAAPAAAEPVVQAADVPAAVVDAPEHVDAPAAAVVDASAVAVDVPAVDAPVVEAPVVEDAAVSLPEEFQHTIDAYAPVAYTEAPPATDEFGHIIDSLVPTMEPQTGEGLAVGGALAGGVAAASGVAQDAYAKLREGIEAAVGRLAGSADDPDALPPAPVLDPTGVSSWDYPRPQAVEVDEAEVDAVVAEPVAAEPPPAPVIDPTLVSSWDYPRPQAEPEVVDAVTPDAVPAETDVAPEVVGEASEVVDEREAPVIIDQHAGLMVDPVINPEVGLDADVVEPQVSGTPVVIDATQVDAPAVPDAPAHDGFAVAVPAAAAAAVPVAAAIPAAIATWAADDAEASEVGDVEASEPVDAVDDHLAPVAAAESDVEAAAPGEPTVLDATGVDPEHVQHAPVEEAVAEHTHDDHAGAEDAAPADSHTDWADAEAEHDADANEASELAEGVEADDASDGDVMGDEPTDEVGDRPEIEPTAVIADVGDRGASDHHVPVSGVATAPADDDRAPQDAHSGLFRMHPGHSRETIYRDGNGNILYSVIHKFEEIFGVHDDDAASAGEKTD